MRYAQIRSSDISNGLGIGVSLFTQGCPIHCPGCHNKSIWDFEGGTKFTQGTQDQILKLIEPDHIVRFSILGGEPLLKENLCDLYNLISRIKSKKPNIKIWLWTGYTLKQLKILYPVEQLSSIFKYVDYIIDGPFIQEQKDITLKFRGSANQKIWKNIGNLFNSSLENPSPYLSNYLIILFPTENALNFIGFKEVAENEVE